MDSLGRSGERGADGRLALGLCMEGDKRDKCNCPHEVGGGGVTSIQLSGLVSE